MNGAPNGYLIGCLLAAVLAGCAVEDGPPAEAVLPESGSPSKDDSNSLPLRFLPGELALPSHVVAGEVAEVFRSEEDLEDTLLIDNPGIDFDEEWAVFYATGTSRPDLEPGYQARVDVVRLSQTGLTLMTYVATLHNGDCAPRPSRPFILVGVPIPADPPPYTRIYRNERTRDCPDEVVYYDGVAFTEDQALGALAAANQATDEELDDFDIFGAQQDLITGGRPWGTLSLVASTAGIGPTTMRRLRDLGALF